MSKKILISLFLILPFINVIAYRIGDSYAMTLLVLLFVSYIFISPKKKFFNKKEKKFISFNIVYTLFLLFLLFFSIILDIDNFYYIRFYFAFIVVCLIFSFKSNWDNYFYNYLEKYLKYLIVLFVVFTCLDFALILSGLNTFMPMFNVELESHAERPLGLMGQSSVNGCMICFLYLFHKSILLESKKKSKKDWLFWFVSFGIAIQGSGSGFISYFFVLLSKLNKKKRNKINYKYLIIVLLLLLVISYYVISSNLVYRISYDYIVILYEYVNSELISPYLKLLNNQLYLWFGMPDFPISIDLGPLFIVGTVGLVGFIILTTYFLCLIFKTKSIDMRLAIVSLLVGNLHYPVMFYTIMHFLWFVIGYCIFVLERVNYFNDKLSMNLSSQQKILADDYSNNRKK